jgi:hypothetical protein
MLCLREPGVGNTSTTGRSRHISLIVQTNSPIYSIRLAMVQKLGIVAEIIGQPWVNEVTMYTHMREVIREN